MKKYDEPEIEIFYMEGDCVTQISNEEWFDEDSSEDGSYLG